MKKIACLMLAFFILTSCSVQEKMSPWIFTERIQKTDKNISIDTDNSYFENGDYVFYASYADDVKFIFEISTDEHGNSDKISLACTQTDKTDEFVLCAMRTIEAYAPDDSADEVMQNLFSNKEPNDKCIYYDTQWYSYAAVLSEKGLFFSVESKKLIPQSEVEFSLKQNDIVEY